MPIELKKILLVEDNEDDIDLTLLSFKNNRIGNEVVVARDGAEALDYLFGTGKHQGRDVTIQPVVVFLDINLPKINGLDVLKKLRNDPRTRRLPVVILTSSVEERDLLTGYDLGVNSYIRKPVDLDQFDDAVKQLGLYWTLLNELPSKLSA
jgi:two-component system response regulator